MDDKKKQDFVCGKARRMEQVMKNATERNVTIPSALEIPFSALLALSQECWRLKRIAASPEKPREGPAFNYAIRQISALLAELGIQIQDYAGHAYDPGMAPEVLDVVEDPAMAPGSSRIDETLSATVTWKGLVVNQGQIVVRQAALQAAAKENDECNH
jgi:hypothetical protein